MNELNSSPLSAPCIHTCTLTRTHPSQRIYQHNCAQSPGFRELQETPTGVKRFQLALEEELRRNKMFPPQRVGAGSGSGGGVGLTPVNKPVYQTAPQVVGTTNSSRAPKVKVSSKVLCLQSSYAYDPVLF